MLRRYVRLSRSLRVTRPRSNDVRLIVHGTPLVRKSSACEVSQSTVMRRTCAEIKDAFEGHPFPIRVLKALPTYSPVGMCTLEDFGPSPHGRGLFLSA